MNNNGHFFYMSSKAGVFAGEDIVSGAATVVSAMGQGKKAARAMHKHMTGEEPPGFEPPGEAVQAE